MNEATVNASVYVRDDNAFAMAHRPGTLTCGRLDIFFMGADIVPQLEQLKAECQRQIDAVLAARAEILQRANEKIDALRAEREADGFYPTSPEVDAPPALATLPIAERDECDIPF